MKLIKTDSRATIKKAIFRFFLFTGFFLASFGLVQSEQVLGAIYEENFDAISVGNSLSSGSDWSGSTSWKISDDFSYSGSNSLKATGSYIQARFESFGFDFTGSDSIGYIEYYSYHEGLTGGNQYNYSGGRH